MKLGLPSTLLNYIVYRTTLFIVLLFGIVTLSTILFIHQEARSRMISLQQSLTRTLAEELRVRGNSLQTSLDTISNIWISTTQEELLSNELVILSQAVIQSKPAILSLWFVDGETMRVKTSIPFDRSVLEYDVSSLVSQIQQSQNVPFRDIVWTPIRLNPFFYNPVFPLSIKAGKDICIAWVDPQLFLSDFTTARFAPMDFFSVFASDSEGNIVVHPEPRLILRRENIRSVPAVQEALETHQPSISTGIYHQLTPNRAIVTTAPVEGSGWVVGVVQEVDRVQTPLVVFAAGGGIILVLFALLSFASAKRVSKSLKKEFEPFAQNIEAIRMGNYSQPIPPQRFKELEFLRTAVLSMQEAIQKREKSLTESQTFIRALLDTIPARVFWKDLDSIYRGCNLLFAITAGKDKPENIIGLNDYAMPWRENAERFQAEDREIVDAGKAMVNIEQKSVWADGSNRWLYATKVPLRDSLGTIIGVLGTTVDITTLKEREEEIKALNAELEHRVEERTLELLQTHAALSETQDRLLQAEKLSALGRLASQIGHEMNTPLGAIRSSIHSMTHLLAQFLGEDLEYLSSQSEEDRSLFNSIVKGSTSSSTFLSMPSEEEKALLDRQIKEAGIKDPSGLAELILDLSLSHRLEELLPALQDSKKRDLLRRAEKFAALLRAASVIELSVDKAYVVIKALNRYLKVAPSIEKRVLHIEEDLETILVLLQHRIKDGVKISRRFSGVRAWGFGERLPQVWLNLINNALQAMDYRGELVIETTQEKGMVFVSIIDNGHGIPEEVQPRILEPFFSTKTPEENLGMGLQICRSILQEEGGSLSFESRSGYTCFTVTLSAYNNS